MKITFNYVSRKGEISERTVDVQHLEFLGKVGEPGWYISGQTEKGRRSFALDRVVLDDKIKRGRDFYRLLELPT